MKRWKCPRCSTGRNAPSRMAKDDVRLYCLPCSAETGKLTRVLCPSLDAQREQKRGKAKEKRQKQRERMKERETDHHLLHDGTDVRNLVQKARKLEVWKRDGGPQASARVRKATVTYRMSDRNGGTGYAKGGYHVTLTFNRNMGKDEAAALIIHEFSHISRGNRRSRNQCRWHDHNFHALLLAAAREWWPWLGGYYGEIQTSYQFAGGPRKSYSMDHAIKTILRVHDDPQALAACRRTWGNPAK